MIGTGFGQILYGPLSDRFGRKKPAMAGILVFVIASILCATILHWTSWHGIFFALVAFGAIVTLGFTAFQTVAALGVLIAAIVKAPVPILMLCVVLCFTCSPGINGNSMTLGMHPFPHKAASAAALIGMFTMFAAGATAAALSGIHSHVVINMGIAMLGGASMGFFQATRIKA